jgi:hypothetical protein
MRVSPCFDAWLPSIAASSASRSARARAWRFAIRSRRAASRFDAPRAASRPSRLDRSSRSAEPDRADRAERSDRLARSARSEELDIATDRGIGTADPAIGAASGSDDMFDPDASSTGSMPRR